MKEPLHTKVLNNIAPTMSTVDTNHKGQQFWKIFAITLLASVLIVNTYQIYLAHLQIKEFHEKKKNGNDNGTENN